MPPVTPRALAFLQNRKDDLRFAFRTMRKSLGFTMVAVFSLALGIGANTAIFTLIDAVLLKSLPVENPSRLYVVTTSQSGRTNAHWTYPDYLAVRDRNQGFSGTIAYSSVQPSGFTAGSGGDTRAEVATGLFVSGNYFDLLGVSAAAGTLFNPNTIAKKAPLRSSFSATLSGSGASHRTHESSAPRFVSTAFPYDSRCNSRRIHRC